MTDRRMVRIEGYVWCERWGELHFDELDPYAMGPDEHSGLGDYMCKPEDHRPVYYRERKGDWRDDGTTVG